MTKPYSTRLAGFSAALALAATALPANAEDSAWQKAADEAAPSIVSELSKAFPGAATGGKADFAPFATALKNAGLGKPQAAAAASTGGGERRGGGGPDTSAADVEFLISIDANRDGRVTAEEIATAVQADLRKAFDRKASLDTDTDGRISRKEYAISMPRKFGELDDDGLDEHGRGHFKREDLDADGSLSLGEVARPVVARALARARAIQLVARLTAADTNHDGALSTAELNSAFASAVNGSESPWKELGFTGDSLPLADLYRLLSRLPAEEALKLDESLRL